MKNNKIIVPTGYMGTGSSAISDLLNEYDTCYNPIDYFEFVFLHCPNGVFDLVDRLLYNNNALKSSYDLVIFRNQMKKLFDKKFWWVGNYKKVVGDEFMTLTDEYINSLVDFKFDGYWYVHEELNWKMFLILLIQKPFKILFKDKIKFKKVLNSNDKLLFSFKSEQEINELTKKYIQDVLSLVNKKNKDIILDQLLLPFNLYRVDDLFDENLRTIVVDRDPRDLFILNKYMWTKRNFPVPIPLDVNEFCKYFRKIRESEKKTNSKKVLKIQFEDLVYKYDESLKSLEKFLGYTKKSHVKKGKFFVPTDSIKNTQVFRDEKYKREIEVIEKQLKEYLYDYPYELNNDVKNTVLTIDLEREDYCD